MRIGIGGGVAAPDAIVQEARHRVAACMTPPWGRDDAEWEEKVAALRDGCLFPWDEKAYVGEEGLAVNCTAA
jgi:hypothetical protein